jgi:RNA polymerase sigma-70 factor (ECF subfamily)
VHPDASPARDGRSLAAAITRSRDDPPAFAVVYRACSRNVLLFLTRRTYDPEVALELTAETFARAFALRRRFKGEVDAEVEAWLYGIARRQLWRWFRRGRVERKALDALEMQVPAMPEDEGQRVEELAGLRDIRAAIAVELARLPSCRRGRWCWR